MSRVPSGGLFRIIGLLRLRRVGASVAIKCGLGDGGVKRGDVVGVTNGFFSSRRLGRLTIIDPGIALYVVGSCRIIRGGGIMLPRRLGNVIEYPGPGYVAGGRPVGALFRITSSDRQLHYRCYGGRISLRRIGLMWLPSVGRS